MVRPAMIAVLVALLSQPTHVVMTHAAEPQADERQHRVVMHVNSGEEKIHRGALNNIRHLYQALGREHLRVELVVHGEGLVLYVRNKTTLGQELTQLQADYDVAYTACSNTMKAMKLTRQDLIDEVGDTVPAIVRLMEREEQGWAYIKP